MSGIAKTRKRPTDLSGGMIGFSDKNEQFLKFLASNSDDTFTRPWHKLEAGVRKNRIRKFVEDEALRFNFTELDQASMFQVLLKALDKKKYFWKENYFEKFLKKDLFFFFFLLL